jgi:hypothetical protein
LISLRVPDALAGNPTPPQQRTRLNALSAAVDEVIRQSPGTPFNLRQVEVNVAAMVPGASPLTADFDQTEIRNLYLVNLAKALDYLPGVSTQHLSMDRNEAGIVVRGFNTQVPLYEDGIPISVPYDDYVDFNRFLTSVISEVPAAGISS